RSKRDWSSDVCSSDLFRAKALSFPTIIPNTSPLQLGALPLATVQCLSSKLANITALQICIWKKGSLTSNLDWIVHLLQSYRVKRSEERRVGKVCSTK